MNGPIETSAPARGAGLSTFLLRHLRGRAAPLSDDTLSASINFTRITLIVGLVFLHYDRFPNSPTSPFLGYDPNHHPVATFLNSVVLFFFFACVPLLSVMSGWLFFRFSENALPELRKRILRRGKSLYLPLVFWNLSFLAICYGVYRMNPNAELLGHLNIQFPDATWKNYVNAIFGLRAHPIGFQFWFVRDLFLTAAVSPLLFFGLKRAPLVGALILGVAWILGYNFWLFFRIDVTFFFYLGGWMRLRHARLEIGVGAASLSLVIYLALIVARALAPAFIELSEDHTPYALECATRGMRLFGVVACWGFFQRWVNTDFGRWAARFGSFAFFLHSIHYPMLAEVKILLWKLVPAESDLWMLVHYVTSVIVTSVLGVTAGYLLARYWPAAFALMNGGRAPKLGAASGARPADD